MLEIRPNCELCDKNLPPESLEAYICTYECTFCSECVENQLHNVCPNCGGGFSLRPIRPTNAWRENVSLQYQPASKKRVITQFTPKEIEEFCKSVREIEPKER